MSILLIFFLVINGFRLCISCIIRNDGIFFMEVLLYFIFIFLSKILLIDIILSNFDLFNFNLVVVRYFMKCDINKWLCFLLI